MKVVLQRSRNARVIANNKIVGAIDSGLMILVGVTHEDNITDARYLADKIVNLRVFEDDNGKMNLSLLDVGGSVLSISQFTLYGDVKKGRRPNFTSAAEPEHAEKMYETLNGLIREKGVRVETGAFGKMMEVDFVNYGPVTIIIDSKQTV
ncbi:MAG: D-aminoacyl-tRNA deacylase [Vulcanibacillus sp.]